MRFRTKAIFPGVFKSLEDLVTAIRCGSASAAFSIQEDSGDVGCSHTRSSDKGVPVRDKPKSMASMDRNRLVTRELVEVTSTTFNRNEDPTV